MAEYDSSGQDQWHDISVSVQSDHLTRLAHRASPVRAVAELIWNSLDADADAVLVTVRESLLGIVDSIEVRDNGTGMKFQQASEYFGRLGGSWKRSGNTTIKYGRPLHGKLGRGRFLAFGAGDVIEWSTQYQEDDGRITEFRVVANIDKPGRFRLSDPKSVKDDGAGTGTTVRVTQIEKSSLLNQQKSIDSLVLEFAPYLKSYPNVVISFNGEKLDPDAIQRASDKYELTAIGLSDGRQACGELEIVEWTRSVERAIFFCDSRGVARGRLPARIRAPGFSFTAYLRSSAIGRLDEDGAILMDELHSDVRALAEAARDAMREHFGRRKGELAVSTRMVPFSWMSSIQTLEHWPKPPEMRCESTLGVARES